MSHLSWAPQQTCKSRNPLLCIAWTLHRAESAPGKGKNPEGEVSEKFPSWKFLFPSTIWTTKVHFCTSLRPHEPSVTLEWQIQWYTESSGYLHHPILPHPSQPSLKIWDIKRWVCFWGKNVSLLFNNSWRKNFPSTFFFLSSKSKARITKLQGKKLTHPPSFCPKHRHLNKVPLIFVHSVWENQVKL